MNKEFKMSYETVGSSSYMVITLLPEAKLVNYQLGMMLDNEIKGFLPAFKRVMNGEMVIYYNITSKIPLSQMLEKKKLTRTEFTCLIKGMLTAVREAADYRLPEGGLIFNQDYIYVNPSTCEPGVVFLPLSGQKGMTLRQFIQELVLRGRIELSSDNFIQVLLDVLNEEPFSLERLERSFRKFEPIQDSPDRNMHQIPKEMQAQHGTGKFLQGRPLQYGAGSEPLERPLQPEANAAFRERLPQYEGWQGQPEAEPRETWNRPQEMESRQGTQEMVSRHGTRPPMPVKEAGVSVTEEKEGQSSPKGFFKGKGKKAKPKKEIQAGQESGFDPKKAKKLFLLPQAVIMVALAAAVSFGLFTDANGKLVVNHILAAVIVIAMTEIILYREAYVNSKKPKKEEGKKANAPKKIGADTKKDLRRRPKLSGQPELIQAETGQPKTKQPEIRKTERKRPELIQPETGTQQEALSESRSYEEFLKQNQRIGQSQVSMYGGQWSARNSYGELDDTDIASETELWGSDEVMQGLGTSAYLEFYENGSIVRIPLTNPNGIIIGRLRSQADFVVTNARVGKVHAKFYGKNGQYFVVDINSKNGTFINGSSQRINSNVPYPLHDNDRIMLADSEFTIRCPQR